MFCIMIMYYEWSGGSCSQHGGGLLLLQDLGWFSQALITSKISVYRCMSGDSASIAESPVAEFWNKTPEAH
jgi:hypothetical protein